MADRRTHVVKSQQAMELRYGNRRGEFAAMARTVTARVEWLQARAYRTRIARISTGITSGRAWLGPITASCKWTPAASWP